MGYPLKVSAALGAGHGRPHHEKLKAPLEVDCFILRLHLPPVSFRTAAWTPVRHTRTVEVGKVCGNPTGLVHSAVLVVCGSPLDDHKRPCPILFSRAAV